MTTHEAIGLGTYLSHACYCNLGETHFISDAYPYIDGYGKVITPMKKVSHHIVYVVNEQGDGYDKGICTCTITKGQKHYSSHGKPWIDENGVDRTNVTLPEPVVRLFDLAMDKG